MRSESLFALSNSANEHLNPSHRHAPRMRELGLMVFDHRGRLVVADALAELVLAGLGVELNGGGRLRINALDTTAKMPSAWGLPDWLHPDWIEPVIEGKERLATIVQIPQSQRSTARVQGGVRAYKLRKVVEFIHEHIDQPIGVPQLASIASLSPFHFHREFKRSTGLTPAKYILKARIERAQSRVTALSALTASIAHEVNQPLAGIMTNASTCLRMLDATPPNIDGARETARRTIRDGKRASEVIARLRAMFSKREFTPELLDLNEAAKEVIALSSNDLQRNHIVLEAELADDLPLVTGDRIQLQQVVLNLLRNASDAMADVHDRRRQMLIKTKREDSGRVRLSVRDAGVGLSPESLGSLFSPFYTTKSGGMGIGLFVSRTIVERHQGRLWAEPNRGCPGATFAFSIPKGQRA